MLKIFSFNNYKKLSLKI